MKKLLATSIAGCLALSWSIGYAATAAKPYPYSAKISIVRPKGSVAEASFKDIAIVLIIQTFTGTKNMLRCLY